MRLLAVAMAMLFAASCGGERAKSSAGKPAEPAATVVEEAPVPPPSVDELAERFVKLGLGVGRYDENYVDAYHGPDAWLEAAKTAKPEISALKTEAVAIIEGLSAQPGSDARAAALRRQTVAALARLRMAEGEKLPFDQETKELYDAQAPRYSLAEFDAVLAEIDRLIPGEGALAERVDAFKNSLAIPADKLRPVFDAAIAECRRRSLAHFDLPKTERFSLRFVTDKPWSGYNWYKGDYESVIEVNTDHPIFIDRAVDLGCHEGYPGHHLWNVLVERDLLKGRNWVEYAIYPLYSPQSLIGEGSANYGIELAFPGKEKVNFERDTLYPLAGLDPAKAETLDALNTAQRKLQHAQNHVARDYIDGRITREEAVAMLVKYTLVSEARASQRVKFIETYRGYVINYNLGRDLVAGHIERRAAAGVDRWRAFGELLTTPVSASGL
jgi:hypothetical protein